MRVRTLSLTRYGRFENQILDFGPDRADADVTLVYGANEAGKSTAFAAWLDLLYGIPLQTPYSFRFERKSMQIGAVIETADGPLSVERSSKSKGSLTDGAGRVLSDTRLSALLFGLDRDAYRTRFSLDETVLREGGEEIAKSQGDLGQLLHAGASGLSGLATALDAVEQEVQGFHKKGGRSTRMARLKREIADKTKEINARRVSPREYDAFEADRISAEQKVEDLDAELRDAKAALALLDVAARHRALMAERTAAEAELSSLPAGPPLPRDAVALVMTADRARSDARRAQEDALTQQRLLTERLTQVSEDAVGQEIAALILALDLLEFEDGSPLLPRAATARADLPKRRSELCSMEEEIAHLAEALAGSTHSPRDLLIAEPEARRLEALATEARQHRRTATDLAHLQKARAAELGPPIPRAIGLETLEAALTAWHRNVSDPAEFASEANRAAAEEERHAMGLPSGWPDLVKAGLPADADLAALAASMEETRVALDRANSAKREEDAALAREQAALAALAARPDAVGETALHQARQSREAKWSAHLETLDAESAKEFEAAMRADDAAQAEHRDGAETRAALRQREEAKARLVASVAHWGAERSRLLAKETKQAERFDAVCDALGLPSTSDPGALRPRRDKLEAAMHASISAKHARSAAERAQAARTDLAQHLTAALIESGAAPPEDVSGLPTFAESWLKDLRRHDEQARDDAARRQALESLARNAAQATVTAQDAEVALRDGSAHHWCAGYAAEPMLETLARLNDLSNKIATADELSARICSMETALGQFEHAASPLRHTLELEDDAAPDVLMIEARRRASSADARATERKELQEQLDSARVAEQNHEDEAEQAAREIADVLHGQDMVKDIPLRLALSKLEARDQLRETVSRLDSVLAELTHGYDLRSLADEEAILDPNRAARLSDSVEKLNADRDAAQRLAGAARQKRDAALAAEGGAMLDQERATLLETLAEEARSGIALQFGLIAARQALRRFRDSRRSKMLRDAEATFAKMTRGAWPRLDTEQVGASERLVGVRGGTHVQVKHMSTGTQGQLYLALRVAGYQDFVASHGPLPFITDDVHETFDDGRARAALEIALEMGRIGQTIVFTHHRHLVGIARSLNPDIRVIDLTTEPD